MWFKGRLEAAASLLLLGAILASCDGGSSSPAPPASLTPGANPSPVAEPAEQWRFVAPAHYYVRVAAQGEVVVVAAAPDFPQFHPEERFLVALERDSGAIRWKVTFACAPLYPAADNERAYLPCNDGSIRAWNLRDGSPAWSVDTGSAPVFIIPAGRLLLVADGDPDEHYDLTGVDPAHVPDGRVRAFEVATGKLRWELPLASYSAFLALENGVLYVVTTDPHGDGEALAVEPATGRVLWRTRSGPATSRPFATKDAVFVAEATGGLHRLSARDGSEQWSASVPGGGVFQAPVSINGTVVAGTNVNFIYSLDAANGSVIAKARYCDCAYSAIALGDLVLTSGPWLALLDPANLAQLWTYQAPPGAATLAVAGDWFFVPVANTVVAFRFR